MIAPSILNPWVLLAALAGLAGAAAWGHHEGSVSGQAKIQLAWNNEKAAISLQSLRNQELVQEAAERLQEKADQERKANARQYEDLDRRYQLALGELQQRPARPTGPTGVAASPSFGANGGGTGAGLYRDDAMFLAGKADLWQRIRLQRDACYRQYENLAAALERLRAAAAPSQ